MGKLFNEVINRNYTKVLNNKVLTIPWGLDRIDAVIPGFIKESYTIITGSTGSGKTKFTKFLLFSVIKLLRDNKIKAKIKWYALEESEEHFFLSLISAYLFEKHNIRYSTAELQSYKKNVKAEHLPLIEELDDFVENEIKPHIDVIDYIRNPTGIYKDVRELMHTIGKDIKSKKIVDGQEIEFISGYKYNDEDTFVFVIIDHATFLQAENVNKDFTQWKSLQKLSQDYLSGQLKDRFKCCVILIQQQASDTENQEYYRGETIITKLQPTLNGLGIYKNTQQDATMVIGLFNPARYNVKNYNGYDITTLQHYGRFAIILKDRHFGSEDTIIPLLFNGAINQFQTLPKENTEELKNIYTKLKQLNK